MQGVLESFLGHALAGGFFCLLAGQPLTVLGCTGPVLIFERILVDFCRSRIQIQIIYFLCFQTIQ
jgi:hypothetical protein